MAILSYATAAASYGYGTATSVFFRPDASTSRAPAEGALRKSPYSRPNSSLPSSNTASGAQFDELGSDGAGPREKEKREGEQLCREINKKEDLYEILGVGKKAKLEEIRRAFLGRSRMIHPDKLPHYAPATPAFQRLSYAYETLSKPGTRRLYDLGGRRGWDSARDTHTTAMGDETLNGVLRNVFNEFLSGDFEMIRVFVNALNEGNPGLNLGDEAVDNLEGVMKRIREVLLAGQKYMRLVKFELIRLYEIQHSLRSLSYFDVMGRLRLTLALTRVTLEIPMVLDRAMRDEVSTGPSTAPPASPGLGAGAQTPSPDGTSSGQAGELQSRGLLGPRVKGCLVIACKVLEKGERFGT